MPLPNWLRSCHQPRRKRNADKRRQRLTRLIGEPLESRWLLAADSIGGLWNPIDQLSRPATDSLSYLRTTEFGAYSLDVEQLRDLLDDAPMEFTSTNDSIVLTLPDPDGNGTRFEIFQSPIMAPELAAKFPEIQTFAGQGIDNPAATVRFDLTPAGFHAQVLSPDGAWYIDPYFHLDDSVYATYSGKSTTPDFSPAELTKSAPIDHDSGPNNEQQRDQQSAARDGGLASRSGTQLRTYRTAVAATGEYTAFHGGTVPLAQSAIVTAINRVTGIYETEVSIRLELVANNDLLVYTDAGTDPYTNDVNQTQLGVNQTNIDAEIGQANYDLGHLFTTDSGGLAFLGVVGLNSFKAQGATGLPNPIGDRFYVDFVAHEIGHQFGGNHTFNGDSGNCAGGNRTAATAYEPGSGSTIQAYAGICGDDNLQDQSDPYFHSASFDQFVNYVDNVIPAVGTRTSTGNTVPTVNAGGDFIIPARTPFMLTATGSDGDGDVLTYNWEQRDLGPQQDVSAGDNGSSPLFRSWLPTTDPTRTFPRLSSLLNNTTVIGETLPTTSRTMNFRATVRDNRAGGGAVNTDDMTVTSVDTGTAFAVTSPNTAVTLPAVSSQTVTWNVAGSTGNGINTPNVNILLSIDGGSTYPLTLASAVPNDGSHDVVMPGINTESARIKVEGDGNIFFDISDTNFTIGAAPALTCSAYEDFDGVTVPNLPAGWTTEFSGTAGVAWTTVSGAESDSAPNHAFVPNPSNVSDNRLISPILLGPSRLAFRHDHNLEEFGGEAFDGAILEISINGGAFEEIITAGGSFVVGGYNGNIQNTNFGNPLGTGTAAWVMDSNGYIDTEVDLPADAVGQNVQFRWRLGSDNGFSDVGWRVDNVQLCNPPAPTFDYGDAPDPSYPTLIAGNGAAHRIGPLFLGAAVDDESDGQPNGDASGDDNNGSDDEDGVTLPASISAGSSVAVDINASVGLGVLNAWIDFNDNGDWSDPGEQIFTNEPLAAGTNNLNFNVPAGATSTAQTFARFRLSTIRDLSYDGPAIDGEVEDYAVAISGAAATLSIAPTDADKVEGNSGTTPFTFTVTRANNTTGITTVDYAVTGSGANPANARDFGGLLPRGTISFADTETDQVVTIDVGGDLEFESDEAFTVTLSNPSAPAIIAAGSAVGTIQNDDSFVPLYSITPADNDQLERGNGETTAYTFTINRSGDTSAAGTIDYAVTGSGASLADGADFVGAALPSGTVNFGPGQPSALLLIDVAGDNVNEADDRFTVTLSNPSGSGLITADDADGVIRNDDNTVPNVWLNEFHYDNTGGDTGEFVEVAGTAFANLSNFRIELYDGATGGNYNSFPLTGFLDSEGPQFDFQYGAASFSIPGATGIQNGNPDGIALVHNNTEVVDFISYGGSFTATAGPAAGMTSVDIGVTENESTPTGFSLQRDNSSMPAYENPWLAPAVDSPGDLNRIIDFDFGDAPDTYRTTLADDGARHRVTGPTLGFVRDVDADGIASVDANGDDLNGLADEDGVTVPPLAIGDVAVFSVDLQNSTGAFLDAWIDFNGDGSFAGALERIATSQPLTTGTNIVTVNVPGDAATGQTYARFRVSSAGGLGPAGLADDGEVEDYAVTLQAPTGSGTFGSTQAIGNLTAGQRTALADINGDGHEDVVGVAFQDNIFWYANDGLGNFVTNTVTSAAGLSNGEFALGDLDLDGDIDIVHSGSDLATYENDGAGNFTRAVVSALTGEEIVVADVDGDGDNDFVTGGLLYRQTAPLTFTSSAYGTVNLLPYDAADIDNDGDIDLAAVNRTSDRFGWLENDGMGSFTEHLIADGTINEPDNADIADIDDDGDMDIAVGLFGGTAVLWYENDGNENFIERTASTAVGQVRTVQVADVDGDGANDIIVAGNNLGGPQILYNDGSQNFSVLTIQTTQANLSSAAVGDIDGDGDLDVVAAATSATTINWYPQEDIVGLDFGDAPNASQSGFASSYPVTLADDGARHTTGAGPRLGELVDAEPDGQNSIFAIRDDAIGSFDEDGVRFSSAIIASSANAQTAARSRSNSATLTRAPTC